MIDEGYRHSTPPIVLTKVKPPKPDIPRDEFRVKYIHNNDIQWAVNNINPHCMRFVEKDGISYAITYWNCPYSLTGDLDEFGAQAFVIYDCANCKMVTWIDILD